MQTIRLYILLEVLKVFLVALAALTLLLMLIGVIREVISPSRRSMILQLALSVNRNIIQGWIRI